VLKIQGKPESECTFAAINLSSLRASVSVIGWRVRRAHARDAIDCMTIFLM
jgi:hypothetical protein